jgi:pyruvate/2-oxoglutarate dehydrogenase complex dihydrolipoamide acyltransferase (E2) component
VKIGSVQIFPDLVLTTSDKARKLMGTVEVETAESVNNLEAMSQWAHLGRAKAPFHLYVPAGCVEIARRLAAENKVNVAELWSFHTIGDQTRFTLVDRTGPAIDEKKTPAARPAKAPAAKPAAARKAVAAKKSARPAKPAAKKTAKPKRK